MSMRLGRTSLFALLTAAPWAAGPALGQDEPPKPPEKQETKAEEPKPAGPPASARPKPTDKTKPYDKVVTPEAKTSAGLFQVHRVDDKILYEIPTSELGKEMLWVTQIEQTQTGYGQAGAPVGDRVVRWEVRGDDVLLRDVQYQIRADVEDPIRNAVKASSVEAIIAVFPIQAYGKDKRPVIDVTSIFTNDLPEFSAKGPLRASGIDSRRTFIEKAKAFPTNIETKILATYRPRGGAAPGGNPFGGGGDAEGSGVTAVIHHSMIKLPEEPMKPRRKDDRVGFFDVSFQDYGSPKQEVEEVSYITRWRLEKKDPKAEISEPKQPIVFYIGREIPAKWRPYVKKGIEAWQPAFEKAGFKNAVIAKEPPTEREDPDWDPEDARYSSVRWLPSTIENAFGPHVHDPRTGEILEADIRVYHNILKLARDWYFVQASPNDPRAQQLPLPDDLLGDLLAYVVTHEVGHSLGFPHNMKASSSYTVEELRNAEFTKKYGVEASIMDYGRFNYVAQPGDNARLIPIVGPYDEFAVEWGYREFPDAKTYEQQKAELDKIVARQKDNSKLLFGDPNPAEDPSQQTEDLGSDPIAATELGLKNLDRVAGFLVKATAKPGENYDLLRNMYQQVLNQRNRELGHVVNVVGGFVRKNFWFPEATRVYNPVPGEQQKKAVAFLLANGFQVPKALVEADIVNRLEATGTADRILGSQQNLLRSLLSDGRLKRMTEQANREPEGAYRPADLMKDLTEGLLAELKASPVDVSLYRRNLQRSYVNQLARAVESPSADSDLPALARGTLEAVGKEIKALFDANKEISPVTRLHLEDLKTRVEHALDAIPSGSGGASETIVIPGRRGAEIPGTESY